jgi:hypothetical protein
MIFINPWSGLVPWLAAAGAAAGLRQAGLRRRFTLLAIALFALQYALNTFVLVIAPVVRYMVASFVLLPVLAALPFSRFSDRSRGVLIAAATLPSLLLFALVRAPASEIVQSTAALIGRHGPVHATERLANIAYVDARTDPALASGLLPGEPPVGGLAVFSYHAFDPGRLGERCGSGELRWQPVDRIVPASLPWRMAERLGVAPLRPARIAAVLRRDTLILALARRIC